MGQSFTQQNPAAVDKTTCFCKSRVLGHKKFIWHAVTIEKHEVIPFCEACSQITCAGGGKTSVGMPHMSDRTGKSWTKLGELLHLLGT